MPAASILAVITNHKDMVSGGAPIFFARDEAELAKKAGYIAKILDASVHELENGTYIIVKH